MKLVIERGKKGETLLIEGATQNNMLGGSFRNFQGAKRKAPNGTIVNDEGKRNFNLSLTDLPLEALDELVGIGVKVKELPPKNDEYGDEPLRFVKVNVAMDGLYPPELKLISANGKQKTLTENQLAMLDGCRFRTVDLIIRTYHRDENTTTLYLQKGFFTIEQDPISAKYEDVDLGEEDDDNTPPFN